MKDPIYIKHPVEKCNETQTKFIAGIENPDELAYHVLMFNFGNAAYRYHELGKSQELTPELYEMWLDGLREPMRSNMAKLGFEENKRTLAFTRFANEMADVGLDEFVMNLLNEEHGRKYQEMNSEID